MKKLLTLFFISLLVVTSFLLLPRPLPRSSVQNLESILPTPTPSPIPVATVGLMGDLGLGRNITATARAKKDFSWSLGGVTDWLVQNDFNLANLESPIIAKCPPGLAGTFTFCGDPRFLPYLKKNKFVLSLNNNHILNYGTDGLDQTKNYLQTDYIADDFYKKTVNDITFGFLGYNFISYPNLDKNVILNKVSQHDSQVDWLIISLHWGNEYLKTPENWRVEFAHDLIDRGADIIHGQHPHVLQPIEYYKGKPIYYSLGNFVFDQNWSYETSHSEMIKLTLTKDKMLNQQIVPITIKFNSRPETDP